MQHHLRAEMLSTFLLVINVDARYCCRLIPFTRLPDYGQTGVDSVSKDTQWTHWSQPSKYLNNLIEQDHRNIKSRTKVMLGFKRFRGAATTISGIELMHRIRKGQFNLATLDLKDTSTPTVWNAVLSVQ